MSARAAARRDPLLRVAPEPVAFTGEVHPLADRWPMLPADELEALADDIAAEGFDPDHALALDGEGRLVDGRNRLAACSLAGVAPVFRVHKDLVTDGDVRRFIRRENAQRRNVTTGQKAMAVAEDLAADGKRRNGRWMRGAINQSSGLSEDVSDNAWIEAMRLAGLVIDHLPELADLIIAGEVALSDAARQAAELRDRDAQERAAEQRRAAELDELRARKPHVAALIDAGDLTLEEGVATVEKELAAEKREAREREEAVVKFSSDVAFSIGCLAPLHAYDERRAQVADLRLDLIGGAHITAGAIEDAIASLRFIAEVHREAL